MWLREPQLIGLISSLGSLKGGKRERETPSDAGEAASHPQPQRHASFTSNRVYLLSGVAHPCTAFLCPMMAPLSALRFQSPGKEEKQHMLQETGCRVTDLRIL